LGKPAEERCEKTNYDMNSERRGEVRSGTANWTERDERMKIMKRGWPKRRASHDVTFVIVCMFWSQIDVTPDGIVSPASPQSISR
jgi:hypothetical protein